MMPWMRGCVVLALAYLVAVPAHAGLFDDDEARRRLEQLRQETDARLAKLEESAREQTRAQALFLNQIEAMRSELARLRGQLEVTANDLEQSQKRQKDFYLDLDTRVRKLETQITELSQKVGDLQRKPNLATAAPDVSPEQESKDYDAAVNALRAGRYVDAATAFRQFIRVWPKSSYQPGAHYWAAAALVQARDYATAADYYKRLLNAWSDDALAPDAMLGLSTCEQEQGDAKGARKTLENLVAKYPSSEAAKIARQRLAKK